MTTMSMSNVRRIFDYVSPPVVALILAIILFFAGGLINPNFLNVTQAINIIRLASFLGIIAAGQTLVIISGGEGTAQEKLAIFKANGVHTAELPGQIPGLLKEILGSKAQA